MNKKDLATFDMLTTKMQSPFVERYRPKGRKPNRQEDIEIQLRRLEYRLIILSLMQGQGRTYLNRMERMQYEDIAQHLNRAMLSKPGQKKRKAAAERKSKSFLTAPQTHQEQESINYWMHRFQDALQELDKEPCDQGAQHELQETGKNLIPLIRHHLSEAMAPSS